MTVRLLALLVGAAILGPPIRGRADPPACPEQPPADAEVQDRLAWIERQVDEHEDDVRRWVTGFIVLHTLLAGVNATLAISTPDDRQRIDLTVNTISATLGLLTLVVPLAPLVGAGGAIRSLPRRSESERLRALRAAEARLRQSADASSFVRSPAASLLSAGYVTAASLTLLFLDRPAAAVVHAIGGAILGQGRLLLHPAGAVGAWRRYRSLHPDAGCESARIEADGVRNVELAVGPAFSPNDWGVALGIRF